ncbi:peptidoglycan DD-metalloendopeptidase family protein [Pedobacter sp. MW01-1-1]|uniref:peptidoglycan DD-metalloendopeptidase family protein n=1 Tax=Pedobacter sp. MW01-1-1 TaxID=3383027 RepID=UPI003FED8805
MIAFKDLIEKHAVFFQKVIRFEGSSDTLLPLDFTANNTELTPELLADTDLFSDWVKQQLDHAQATYGIGGYNEHRTIYARSMHFDAGEEPRRLHLGVDIWANAGTPIYNFYEGKVHSFANNSSSGDYGGTIILQYQLNGLEFYALYGHLSLASFNGLQEGQSISAGQLIGTLGKKEENGNWPPHLHFQLILDMQGFKGDYPGVCKFSEREKYLANCPDPNLILASTFC